MKCILKTTTGLFIGASLFLAARALVAQAAARAEGEVSTERRVRLIDAVVKKLNTSYVFPETAKRMEEALLKHEKAGEYEKVTSGAGFAEILTRHLQDVSHDKHLRVRYSAEVLPVRQEAAKPTDAERAEALRQARCGVAGPICSTGRC